MTLEATRAQLTQLIADPDNKVIALSGKWGTGKSHLWGDVRKSTKDKAIKGALYVSLFGVAGIDALKLKLAEGIIPDSEGHKAALESVRTMYSGAKKIAKAIHGGFAAMDELTMLVVPMMLRGRTIVLDDIERKHDKLSVDEVLGFIDEYTQQYNTRIVLILNTDKLSDKPIWDTMREKVIDEEVRLDTTPTEAFDIAIQLRKSRYADHIRKAILDCGVVNIRVIDKIIKTVNRILHDHRDIDEAVLTRIIPSTVLLAAIHYKGLDGGPDIKFVLESDPVDLMRSGQSTEELDAENEDRGEWRLLLQKLGILGVDEFELLIAEYLEAGLVDQNKIATIINRYVAESDSSEAYAIVQKLRDDLLWDHLVSDNELLGRAQAIVTRAHLLDASTITLFYEIVRELPGGEPIAEQGIDAWVAGFDQRHNSEAQTPFKRTYHPRIQELLESAKQTAEMSVSLLEVCQYMIERNGWGARHRAVLDRTSVDDFDITIRRANSDELKTILVCLVDMRIHGKLYEHDFGSALDRFVEACRRIARDPASGRLGRLIQILFDDGKIGAQLRDNSEANL